MIDEKEPQNPDDSSENKLEESQDSEQESPQEEAPPKAESANFPEFTNEGTGDTVASVAEEQLLGASYVEEQTLGNTGDVTALYNVPVQVSAVLGRATMPVSQLLKLGRGAVVELDRRVGESIDIFVNNRLIARGEVVVIDERLGITMTEIIKGDG